jgi:hypothetical protein
MLASVKKLLTGQFSFHKASHASGFEGSSWHDIDARSRCHADDTIVSLIRCDKVLHDNFVGLLLKNAPWFKTC